MAQGFECEFVKELPEEFQTECPICLQILREPYQVICCGKSFCHSCIEHVKALDNPCPHCNARNFNDYPNKGLKQSLYQLKVYCSHKKKGCKWTGELGELDNHLNLDPQPYNKLKGCVFVMVKCTHCFESHQRQHINHHQTEECPKRPSTCEHCKVYKSTFEDVTRKHHNVCKKRPFSCEYCKIFKSTYDNVTTNHHQVCKKRPFTCDYCKVYKSTFEEVTVNHYKVCKKRPFTCKHCKVYKSTFEDVATNHWPVCGSHPVECSNKCGAVLQRQNLESHVAKYCPLTVIKCDFHYAGCEVKLPRKDMGKHLRVEIVKHTSMMAASYHEKIASYKQQQDQDRETIGKLVKENEALKERLAELEKEQKEDHTSITILKEKNNFPPLDIIMNNFEQHKMNNEPWYSPPFYTHHRGYKLCLRCYANSIYVKNYVSVFVYLMQGEFDSELKWPLQGEVTIQLISQDGSNKHHTKQLKLDNPKSYSRLTWSERSIGGRGELGFISHQDCEMGGYLRFDRLHFKVVEIMLK